MEAKVIFLTGATGLVGSQILKIILNETKHKVIVIIRGRNQGHAENRVLINLRRNGREFYKNKRLTILRGDILDKNFGLNRARYIEIIKSIHEIFHCAALAEFRQPLAKVRAVNVGGTKNILECAEKCSQLEKIHYLSSAFIAGNFEGNFSEKDFDVHQKFNNSYEQSKFEAELLIRKYKNQEFKIYRPSIIVGEYNNGETNNFRMFYQPFRSLALGLFSQIPVDNATQLNIIPCDAVAMAIFLLSQVHGDDGVYHVVSPQNIPILHLMKFASKYFGYKEPHYVSLEDFNLGSLNPVTRRLIKPYIPYFNFKTIFESYTTSNILKR